MESVFLLESDYKIISIKPYRMLTLEVEKL